MDFAPFNQPPPELGNQWDDDRPLRSQLSRIVPADALAAMTPSLRRMGEIAGGELFRAQQEDRLNEPTLTSHDPWGHRIDRIDVSPLWVRAERIAAEEGVVATAYEKKSGALSRVHQMGLMYLFGPSTDVYACPLAMTDGAARTLLASGNAALAERALPHLLSRDPRTFWTSGQWMTESTGGSDVGTSETVAVRDEAGGADAWRLYGRKWFTSATTSQMALTLGRPEGNGPGGRGLAVYYVETRRDDGRLAEGIEVNRLKDKLGTKKVPTAELMLRGVRARAVIGTTDGVRNITPMLNVTRTWNATMAVAGMRRGVALARDYARKRRAFGAALSDKPLHLDTLAALAAETEAALALVLEVGTRLGRMETGEASERDDLLLRVLTPLAKLTTGKQAVVVASEVLECFGGAGYVEDTGLPVLLRDAQVLPIWEGTTNVLSLDVLRAFAHAPQTAALLREEAQSIVHDVDARVAAPAKAAADAIDRALAWLASSAQADPLAVEAGARRFSLTLGRALELLYLARHASWSLAHERDARAAHAAARFLETGIETTQTRMTRGETRALAMDVEE